MLRRLTLILTLVSLVGLLTAPAVAAARPGTGATFDDITAPVVGGGTFAGDITIDRVVASGGDLTAIGSITGTVTDAAGAVVGTVTNQAFTAPLSLDGTCEILDLVLGPLDLDILGLVVTLDTVHLNITAEQGPGNLLGNLLCAVAGLLDGGLNLNGIARLLTQILSILG